MELELMRQIASNGLGYLLAAFIFYYFSTRYEKTQAEKVEMLMSSNAFSEELNTSLKEIENLRAVEYEKHRAAISILSDEIRKSREKDERMLVAITTLIDIYQRPNPNDAEQLRVEFAKELRNLKQSIQATQRE